MIKVGFCVSYDWHLLQKSLPLVYQHADEICLSLDIFRRSWSGNQFHFDEAGFALWLHQIDPEKKIMLYEDDFYLPQLTALENDSRQRNMMAARMGKGGWHLQLDADEYFFSFREFISYLLSINPNPDGSERAVNVYVQGITLFKRLPAGYLFVHNRTGNTEVIPVATNKPEYTAARRNDHFNHISPFFVLHESWARTEEDLQIKLDNWGHNTDFLDKISYFAFWRAIDQYNYRYVSFFHPLKPSVWERLQFVPETDIRSIMKWMIANGYCKVDRFAQLLRNSRVVQRIKQEIGR